MSAAARGTPAPAPFAGFPARAQATAIPNVFFSDVLPRLADPAQVAVVLYAFVLLGAQRGTPRCITSDALARHAPLVEHLTRIATADGGRRCTGPADIATAIDAAVVAVVRAGVLLTLSVRAGDTSRELLFLNTPADRRAVESIHRGEISVGAPVEEPPSRPERRSIYVLYESLIGTLGPGMAEELAEAERLYPAQWLADAFREATAQNARSWRYITRILERWASEGRGDAKAHGDPADDSRYFAGKYGRILKQRLDR
ncbi:MAG: DnaD domain protein [Dehalococcoidia bacterium]|nr:DnaD domain protein [Dehalococcoidia bacterium]